MTMALTAPEAPSAGGCCRSRASTAQRGPPGQRDTTESVTVGRLYSFDTCAVPRISSQFQSFPVTSGQGQPAFACVSRGAGPLQGASGNMWECAVTQARVPDACQHQTQGSTPRIECCLAGTCTVGALLV